MELKKKNLTMSMDLFNWFETRAKEMGITTSSLMVMAMQQYIENQKMIKLADGGLQDIVKKLAQIQKSTNKA